MQGKGEGISCGPEKNRSRYGQFDGQFRSGCEKPLQSGL